MKIHKGTFKIREMDGSEQKWTFYDGSYGNDYPFYVHRKESQKWWTLSHMSTGYSIKANISLKDARKLSKALKDWPLFLMPDVQAINHQKSLLPTHKQQLLQNIIHNTGE
jgi:hypothetical protein